MVDDNRHFVEVAYSIGARTKLFFLILLLLLLAHSYGGKNPEYLFTCTPKKRYKMESLCFW
jgi:hypothetical protein